MKITYFKHRLFGKTEKIQAPRDIPSPYYVALADVLEAIKSGQWGQHVQQCRSFLLSGHKASYDNTKALLPVILPCGLFAGQSLETLAAPTNLMILDFDHFPQSINEVVRLKQMVQQDPYTFVTFISVSGFGLKVLVKVENDINNQTHHQYFHAIKEYYRCNYPELFQYWDDSSKNINRLCYVSHDPDIFVNPNSRIWSDKAIAIPKLNNSVHETVEMDDHEVEEIINFLEGGWQKYWPMEDGCRHDSTFHRAKELAEYGVDKECTLLYFEQFMAEANDPADIRRQIDNAYEKAIFNSKRRK